MRLIRKSKPDGLGRTEFAETVILAAWFWRRRTGPEGGNTRALFGAYRHGWTLPMPGWAPVRHWTFFGLACLHHVDDAGATLKARTPGWSWTFSSIRPSLNFKKVDEYGVW